MKKYALISLLFLCSCGVGNDEIRINEFMESAKKPIVVRVNRSPNMNRSDVTLIDANGKTLYLEYTGISFPDTIGGTPCKQ